MESSTEKRKLCRCPVCDAPMFEKVGRSVFIEQLRNGKKVKTEIERKGAYNRMSIVCGACKRGVYNLLSASNTEVA